MGNQTIRDQKNEKGWVLTWLPLCAVLLAAATAVVVFLQLFLPALRVGGDTYSGFEAAVFCHPAFIQGNELFGTNVLLIAALLVPFIAAVVAGLMWRKAGGVRRIVLLGILAAALLFCAIVYLNITSLAQNNATDKMAEMIYYAEKEGNYGVGGYTVFMSVLCMATAVVCAATAALIATGRKK